MRLWPVLATPMRMVGSIRLAAARESAVVAGGGVLGHAAETGVGDADEDERLGEAGEVEAVGGLAGAPGAAGDVGGARVEEVLTVVKVEDGKAAVGLGDVGGGEVDVNIAQVGEELGAEVWQDDVTRIVVEVADRVDGVGRQRGQVVVGYVTRLHRMVRA